MNRRAWVLIGVLACVSEAHAQQTQMSVSAATQVMTGDEFRLGGMQRTESDLGVSWLRSDVFGGSLGIDANLTRRDDSLGLGRALVTLKDVKAAGFAWEVTAGDSGTPPFVPDFGYSNLSAPTVTFAGAAVSATSQRVTIRTAGGHTTQTRNIFGTDLLDLEQTFYQADVAVRLSDRWHLTTRGSKVTNGDLGPYISFVDWAEDTGAGVTYRPASFWTVSADAGISRFQRRGSSDSEVAPSWLLGTSLSGKRGRFEINAQRFSAGRFATINYPYNDRQGVFSSGELALTPAVRLFGGADIAKTNLNPDEAVDSLIVMPDGTQTRAFGGARLQWGRHSTISLRAEGGGREISASKFNPGYETDTGSLSADWHASLRKATFFTRYERRTNVDAVYAPSSFRQHEFSGQVYFHLKNNRELFAQGYIVRRADGEGGGETDWYAGAGYQFQIQPLSFRFEGTMGRTDDWMTTRSSNRRMLVANVSGVIARRTYLSVDVVLHHAPINMAGASPWYTRSMVRLSRSLKYGSVLVPAVEGGLPLTGPLGSIESQVYIDWNGNGLRDTDEEPAAGVGVSIVRVGSSVVDTHGKALFSRVPAGERLVSLDLSSVPADFDLPAESARAIGVERGKRAEVSFGLVPIGSITGSVFTDEDGDGALSAADKPTEGAVVTTDDQLKSELVRDGRFRFDNMRLGRHTLVLDLEALELGTQVVGEPSRAVELTREQRNADVIFLVKTEKRSEVRKVFPVQRVQTPDPAAPDQTTPEASAAAPSPAPQSASVGQPRAARKASKPLRARGEASARSVPPPATGTHDEAPRQ